MPVTIFLAYAREDEALLRKLKSHLRSLQREGLIDIWYDREISAGAEWGPEIEKHLNAAQIVLLLVSPDFMDSDYCYSVEMKKALERSANGEAIVIPLILRSVYWQVKPLENLQALPTDGKPVTTWLDQDEAFYNVTQGILKVVVLLSAPSAYSLPVVERTQQRTEYIDNISLLIQQSTNGAYPIALLRVEKLSLLRTLTGNKGNFWIGKQIQVAISPDGQIVVGISNDKTIKVWELSTGKELQTLTFRTGWIMGIAIGPNGQMVISRSTDAIIEVWDLATGKELRTFTGHKSSAFRVAISPDGQTVVSGSADMTIKVWELSTGKELQTFLGHTSSVTAIAISLDGQTVVSGSADMTIKVWELSTGKELQTLLGHTSLVRDVAISPDGQMVVSRSDDKTIKVWELSTGKELQTLVGHIGSVTNVVISPDGQTVVSGSADMMIKVWELFTGKVLQTLIGHTGGVTSVAISLDGQTVVSGSADMTIKVWGV